MKKGFVATLLAYLLIICSIPTNVFAELKNSGGKYSYKEDFYAYTAMQYKDKTIISGYENPYDYESGKSFIVDKFGNKTYLKNHYSFSSGNKALTTDMTPLELGDYQDEWGSTGEYSYDFSTGKETEIYGDADGYNKIKTTVIDYYENILETDLSDYKLINEEDPKELAKQKNYSDKWIYFYIDDMRYEGNNVYYGIEIMDSDVVYFYENGLYKDGQVYRNGLLELFGLDIDTSIYDTIETKDGLFLFTEEWDHNLETYRHCVYYRDNSGNIKVLLDSYRHMAMSYMNDSYIVIETGYGYKQHIFKKSSKGQYDLVETLSEGYRLQPSEDNNIYFLKGNEGELQELYQFSNNNIVKINEFNEFYIRDMHIFDHSNMALIGEYKGNIDERWFANISKYIEQQGWINTNGKWYYYKNGVMQKGWLKDGSKWYYLNSGGDMATGWKQVGGKWYYLNSGGDMATGWKQVGGKWYYLNSGGDMATGWKQVGGKWYYLNSGGDMATGWKQVGGKWYYLNSGGDMATGWKQVGGKWYYLNSGGDMATGWKQVGGKWYYMYSSGVMATNTVIDGWRIDKNGVATKIK